ncbi:MAG: UDP-N-acetylmuramoyl-L-alanyl-D-glutamate--2,6-diaminopimelate ligase [Patescibacteria group bacterium]|nr:UDP-N-acetylmuramoyl-L-alanyl-D-glutamate--2,6-diaminopimelate ligase [Patescibacteria group bacterium]
MFIQRLKNFYHLLVAVGANFFYGFPSRKLFVIGVTGTNGKTITVQMINGVLEEAGHKTGMVSTINFQIGKRKWVNKTKFTTINSIAHQKFLAQCVKEKCEFVVIETSSHALDQNRVWGTDYDIGVITNVTREHLDYHRTMGKYRQAKLKLFKFLAGKKTSFKNGREAGFSVINLSMEKPEEFITENPAKSYGYLMTDSNSLNSNSLDSNSSASSSLNSHHLNSHSPKANSLDSNSSNLDDSGSSVSLEYGATSLKQKVEMKAEEKIKLIKDPKHLLQAQDIELKQSGSLFKIAEEEYRLKLPGLFNIENALATIWVGKILKIDNQIIKRALASIKKVPGRMDDVSNDKGIEIIIDYALTPDSMEKVGQLLRSKLSKVVDNQARLYWVFGSCGQRDRGKRPIMGKIVAKYADVIIVTNEDPYYEDPQQIIDEIFEGVTAGGKIEGKNAFRVMNRREAIKKALISADRGDIVVITGKGAEENMKVGNKLIEWNDKKVVKELLKKIETG